MHASATPNRPLALDLALTVRCPLRCRFCTVEKVPVPELTALQWQKVMAAIARLRPIHLISLEGGEPLTRSDLARILAASLEHADEVKIVTSGAVPIDTLPAHLLGHPRLLIEVSVDGPKPVHDYLRDQLCDGCWTGQKCGMVSYWKTGDCRGLLSSVATPPRRRQSVRG